MNPKLQQHINWNIAILCRRLLGVVVFIKAFLCGKSLICNALQGESNYSICINSDLTVSCNYEDFDGSGHIGDLHDHSLEQIFCGEVAQSFRERLFHGRLAITNCSTCGELQSVDKEIARSLMQNYHVPKKGIMIENTVLCNYTCIACPRDVLQKTRTTKSIALNDIELLAKIVHENSIEQVSYFNIGEPFIVPEIHEQISLMRMFNPDIHIITSTNGMLMDNPQKIEAALLLDRIFISLDGSSQKTVEKYQVGCDFNRVYGNMKQLVASRDSKGFKKPIIEWKYVVFNWNDKKSEIERAVLLAHEAGVDAITFVPARNPIYGISFRYHFSGYFNKIGIKSGGSRTIQIRVDQAG